MPEIRLIGLNIKQAIQATNLPSTTNPLALSQGGTGASLADPGADRLMFWDDSESDVAWLTLGVTLAITATTIDIVTTGNWGGTFDGIEGAAYLARANHTGTQLAATVSDFSTAADARIAAAIGVSVQAYDADLTTLGGLAKTDGNFIVGDGAAWVVESGATARTSIGLGSTSNPTFANLTITSFAANWTNAGRTIADLGTVSAATSITSTAFVGGTIAGTTGTFSSYVQGTTANGFLDLRGDSGATSGLRVSDTGNLLLGTTTERAWGGTNTVIQLSDRFSIWQSTSAAAQLGWNVYDNGTQNIYAATDQASRIYFDGGGNIVAEVAASGTAGTQITFTTGWTLSNDGKFRANQGIENTIIGAVTPAAITGTTGLFTSSLTGRATGASFTLLLQNSTTGSTATDGAEILLSGNDLYFWNRENSFLSFGTNNTEKMRINSSGNVAFNSTDLEATDTVNNEKSITIGQVDYIRYGTAGFRNFTIAHNVYYDSVGPKYRTTNAGAQIDFAGGDIRLWTFASGTIDTTATPIQALTITNAGIISVGAAGTSGKFKVLAKGTSRLDGITVYASAGDFMAYLTHDGTEGIIGASYNSASAYSALAFQTSDLKRGYVGVSGGLVWGAPTGGDKGVGTINAVAVYDDNTLLTDYLFDHYFDGKSDLTTPDFFNAKYINRTAYSDFWKANRNLPFMPTQETFEQERNLGRLVSGLWAETETHAIFLSEQEQEIERLKGRVYELEQKLAA